MIVGLLLPRVDLALVEGHDVSYVPSVTLNAKYGMRMVPSVRNN